MRQGHGYSALRKGRAAAIGYTYLVTTRATPNRSLARPPEVAKGICDTLLWIRDQGRLALHSFVVMPDHIHLIITPSNSQTLSKVMHSFKSYSAQEANATLRLKDSMWQAGFYEQAIRTRDAMQHAVEYVARNPVEAGLVAKAQDWPYSSAHENYCSLMDGW